jgi:LemA protein
VRDLNIAIQSFPASLVANALQFSPEPFFELDDPAARAAPEISFAGGKA